MAAFELVVLQRMPRSEYAFALHPTEGNMGQDSEWKTLAEEAAQEEDPQLMKIIEALTRAVDESFETVSVNHKSYPPRLRWTIRPRPFTTCNETCGS